MVSTQPLFESRGWFSLLPETERFLDSSPKTQILGAEHLGKGRGKVLAYRILALEWPAREQNVNRGMA